MGITGPYECSNTVDRVAAEENKVRGSASFVASSKQADSHIVITLTNLVTLHNHLRNLLSITRQREEGRKYTTNKLYGGESLTP